MEETYMKPKLKPKEKPHYVNNKQFSHAVVDYVKSVTEAEAKGNAKQRQTRMHKHMPRQKDRQRRPA